ncbi:hypothetical protein BKA69DRAFT_1123139 [Paraphysoderma sedebokerense]|nr:hypothetical protein BKA69DRAFT_1123139 [Paraphysoderma sedebokerense]
MDISPDLLSLLIQHQSLDSIESLLSSLFDILQSSPNQNKTLVLNQIKDVLDAVLKIDGLSSGKMLALYEKFEECTVKCRYHNEMKTIVLDVTATFLFHGMSTFGAQFFQYFINNAFQPPKEDSHADRSFNDSTTNIDFSMIFNTLDINILSLPSLYKDTRDFKLSLLDSLNVISSFLYRLNEHVNPGPKLDHEEERSILENGFYAVLCCVGNKDRKARLASTQILNGFLTWDEKRNGGRNLNRWCELIWIVAEYLFNQPRTSELYIDAQSMIARTFDSFASLITNPPPTSKILFDIRTKETFFHMIQSHLVESDTLTRKYAVYLIKRVVDLCAKYPKHSQNIEWSSLFVWDNNIDMGNVWKDFFLLYEVSQETYSHLIEPALHKLDQYLSQSPSGATTGNLAMSWWNIIFIKGFQNESLSSRKIILNYILSNQSRDITNRVAGQTEFMRLHFFPALETQGLYVVGGVGNMVSVFGESISDWVRRVILGMQDIKEKKIFVKTLLKQLATSLHNIFAITYLTQGLAQLAQMNFPLLDAQDLQHLGILSNHPTVTTKYTRILNKRFAARILTGLTDPCAHSFDEIATIISAVLSESSDVSPSTVEGKMITDWLLRRPDNTDMKWVESNIKALIASYMTSETTFYPVFKTESDKIARILAFAVTHNPKCLPNILEQFLEKLNMIYSHTYLPEMSQERLLCLLDSIFVVFGSMGLKSMDALKSLLQKSKSEVLSYVENCVLSSRGNRLLETDIRSLYSAVLKNILVEHPLWNTTDLEALCSALIGNAVSTLHALFQSSERTLSTEFTKLNLVTLLGNTLSCAVTQKFRIHNVSFTNELLNQISSFELRRPKNTPAKMSWGDVMSMFVAEKWLCVHFYIRYTEIQNQTSDLVHALETCVDEVDKVAFEFGIPVYNCLARLTQHHTSKHADLIAQAADLIWLNVRENLNNSKPFLPLITSFIQFLFQPAHFTCPELTDVFQKYFDLIAELSEFRANIMTQVSSCYYQFWKTLSPEAIDSLRRSKHIFLHFIMFGPYRDESNQRFNASVCMKLSETDISEDELNTASADLSNSDYIVRVQANLILMHLCPSTPSHRLFARQLLDVLFETLKSPEYHPDLEFNNQITQRKKCRMWSSVLIILECVDDDYGYIVKELIDAIVLEVTTVTRYYIEWALMRILIKCYPKHTDEFWKMLQSWNLKAHIVISLITVANIVGRCLKDPDHQYTFFKEFFSIVPGWLTSNHFTIRSFTQWAFITNWKYCRSQPHLSNLLIENQLSALTTYMEKNEDVAKFLSKYHTVSYYSNDFDPSEDFTVEFIFKRLPWLWDSADDEKISSRIFQKLDPTPSTVIPFHNPGRKFYRKIKNQIDLDLVDEIVDPIPQKDVTEEQDMAIQRKITPWETMLETDMDLSRMNLQMTSKRRKRNDLIVVASLIDKMPNLGGLCRTCEIFNASLLTLHSLKWSQDPGFKSVAVSAERWLAMQEVRIENLKEYLVSLKLKGYRIVGVEQTSTSVSLSSFEFGEKEVVVLGKEREGIPADILAVCDVCVEIPQMGLTRSLNVHVSGAVVIWEYTKQILTRQSVVPKTLNS